MRVPRRDVICITHVTVTNLRGINCSLFGLSRGSGRCRRIPIYFLIAQYRPELVVLPGNWSTPRAVKLALRS